MQQRLEQVLRLVLGFALLGAQPLELADDGGELLLEGEKRERYLYLLACSIHLPYALEADVVQVKGCALWIICVRGSPEEQTDGVGQIHFAQTNLVLFPGRSECDFARRTARRGQSVHATNFELDDLPALFSSRPECQAIHSAEIAYFRYIDAAYALGYCFPSAVAAERPPHDAARPPARVVHESPAV